MTWEIIHGDAHHISLREASIDVIVTDPPYGLEFMGKDFDKLGKGAAMQAWHEAWAREALRVLKPGGHLIAFGGTRTSHRLICGIEDAGFEIRDSIIWIYGSGFPKSLDVSKAIDKAAGAEREKIGIRRHPTLKDTSKIEEQANAAHGGNSWKREWELTDPSTEAAKQWDGWGTALKPSYEPAVLARKPLAGTVAANVLQYGAGGLNIDECRIGIEERTYDLKKSENLNQLARPQGEDSPDARGLGSYGVGSRQVSVGQKTVQGRWPSNVILDGSQEVEALFPQTTSGSIATHHQRSTSKTKSAYGERAAPPETTHGDSGSAARFFYTAKASQAERSIKGTVKNDHPTVKPVALMQYLIKLVLPPGGTVLDPFCGSGSTLLAADRLGAQSIGIELNPDYIALARQRLFQDAPLFSNEKAS